MSIYYDNRAHQWCLDVKVDDKRLQVHSPEEQLLVRMQSIIQANHLSYAKAKRLATDYRQGLIPAGYIGHKYLRPDLGYRILSAYGSGDGFIHTYYVTAKEAWGDLRIQEHLAEDGSRYADYDTYLRTVDSGKPWTLMGLTILRCKISMNGKIRIVKKPPERL